jgi:mono/diheme cytochrome c family protein
MSAPLRKKAPLAAAFALLLPAAAMMATANGGWLKKVPASDRARINPYASQASAAEAGKQVFLNNCAKCHGEEAQGKNGRPDLHSERVTHATDGEIAWILKNGNPWKGMPSWSSLPEQQRWQVITYIRSIQTGTPTGNGGGQ